MASGGKRQGAGRKPGSFKPEGEKRTVRKLYQWTEEEYERIKQAVKVTGVKESKIVQMGTMKQVENILNKRPDGEQCFTADSKPPA